MAKESGLGMSINVDDAAAAAKDISNDIESWNHTTPRAMQDVTGIDKNAMERLQLLADFTISLSGTFNDAADQSHDIFKTVPSTSVARTVTIALSGQTLANEVLFDDYPLTRSATGELTWAVNGQLTGGAVPTWS